MTALTWWKPKSMQSMRSERSSTKYFWMEELAASMLSRYSLRALVALSRASSYLSRRFWNSFSMTRSRLCLGRFSSATEAYSLLRCFSTICSLFSA